MPFVEVFAPQKSVPIEKRDQIAKQLVHEVMKAEGAPDTEHARAISWLVWHDASVWSVGGELVGSGEPARYVVRITVPAPALDDEKRKKIVAAATEVLAKADDDPDRLYNSPSSFILLNEVPDGDWGSIGQTFRFEDIAGYVLTGVPGGASKEEIDRGFNPEEEARESVPVA